jgi:hypothetical protein
VLIAIWVLASDDFSSGGRTLVWVTVAALLLLAAVQAALVVRR